MFQLISPAFAAEAVAEAPAKASFGHMLFMFAFIFLICYVFMIWPQSRRYKKHMAEVLALKKGDKVIFSGIVGKVHQIGADSIEVEVSNGVILTVAKYYINPLKEK